MTSTAAAVFSSVMVLTDATAAQLTTALTGGTIALGLAIGTTTITTTTGTTRPVRSVVFA